MSEQRSPEIRFDEWAAAPAAARQALLGLRAVAATANKSLARFEGNQREKERRMPQFREEVTGALKLLRDRASEAQSCVLNDYNASLPDSARGALLAMMELDTEAGKIRQLLTGSDPDPTVVRAFHPAASDLAKSLRAAADVVAPLYTLLARMDDNLERAAEQFEELHNDLTRRLDDWGSPMPDYHADLALDRVIRKIEEGEEVRILAHYSRAVAWRVWREYLAKISDELPEETTSNTLEPEDPETERERRFECMRECLAKLFPETRWLITEYSNPNLKGREMIKHREKLARMLGLPRAKLTTRIYRIREELHDRLNEYLNK